jgi:NADH:ubiquinone oxidoreductase subunit F (NADH-binding)/(2Fe-2S) ferredoxin/Pyruvate/2-oxoacid:ferredoxin oxidoreductase delta subunit
MDVVKAFREERTKLGLEDKVEIKVTGCHGFCEAEPNVIVHPDGIFYAHVKPEDAHDVIAETAMEGRIVDRLAYEEPETGKRLASMDELPFYRKQKRILLSPSAFIDPERIEDYLNIGGYQSIQKVLSGMNPEEVVEAVKKSGLRGRGGGGFYTGIKWELARSAKGDEKYIICNADEGDPGAYMDRSLLEGNPHSVIEGMIIGGFAIGANKGWIYVRHEYPLAVDHVTKALEQARAKGYLGRNIFGSGFDFDIEIAEGAGAFVCGEETALIESIEGRRGIPRQRPPFPVNRGLYNKPTNVNNVETWATVPHIISKGADWFASIGTEKSKGTKIFSLVGKVKNTGLVEVPMGITLREIIYDVGGGMVDGKKFKAVQTGGPSGGCIPEALIDLPVDFESLNKAGSIMGSGGMIVMDEDTCMVDVARYFLSFLRDESCGKCVSCRDGIATMYDIVDRITRGEGTEEDIETLLELAQVVKDASLCGLGQTASNPVLSTLRYFQDEYMAHVRDKKCPAGVCKDLITYSIDPEKCTGCGACLKACPEEAITGEKKETHRITTEKCVKCGICLDVCKFDAVVVS